MTNFDEKQYRADLEQHRLFCNGEGEIVDICKFSGRLVYRDCPLCEKIAKVKAKKELISNG